VNFYLIHTLKYESIAHDDTLCITATNQARFSYIIIIISISYDILKMITSLFKKNVGYDWQLTVTRNSTACKQAVIQRKSVALIIVRTEFVWLESLLR